MYDVVVNWQMGQAVLGYGWDAFVAAHQIEENDTFLFMYIGDSNFEIRILDSDGCEKTASYFRQPSDFLGAFPPNVPCGLHLPNEQAAPNPGHVHMPIEFDYIMPTGCHLILEQDDKVLEIARTIKSEIPLYVANIRLQLVDHFKEETASSTIKLVAPNCHIYTVGASKHSEDQVVLRSGWGAFVVANHVQKNDILIFSSKEKLA
ncbi:B3 domain-containing protein Os03g0620400-like [Lolium rigidum]|uniref:B3 domain-containing protein Os03g0620400-like n=1 Tax=Lolium rigidum TaxID=89674 RepID=UPI001F5E2CEB|nr:B3 domain-containing protein Os03g0620400-like [Lolium rigidum]